MLLEQQNLGAFICSRLGLQSRDAGSYWSAWQQMCNVVEVYEGQVSIAVVGKYTYLQDSYLSIKRALDHAAMSLGYKCIINWIGGDNGRFDKAWKTLKASK
jgi:CTP synthase